MKIIRRRFLLLTKRKLIFRLRATEKRNIFVFILETKPNKIAPFSSTLRKLQMPRLFFFFFCLFLFTHSPRIIFQLDIRRNSRFCLLRRCPLRNEFSQPSAIFVRFGSFFFVCDRLFRIETSFYVFILKKIFHF